MRTLATIFGGICGGVVYAGLMWQFVWMNDGTPVWMAISGGAAFSLICCAVWFFQDARKNRNDN